MKKIMISTGYKQFSALKHIASKRNESMASVIKWAIDDLIKRELTEEDIKVLQQGQFANVWVNGKV